MPSKSVILAVVTGAAVGVLVLLVELMIGAPEERAVEVQLDSIVSHVEPNPGATFPSGVDAP